MVRLCKPTMTDNAKTSGPLLNMVNGYTYRAVKHGVGEIVNEQAHTNGIESSWAVLKRGYVGVYQKMSPKHLDRYVNEFAGRHNMRELGMQKKRLKYSDLIAGNGLDSVARGQSPALRLIIWDPMLGTEYRSVEC